jgi:NADP-reducing hydrogenase subunit HndD
MLEADRVVHTTCPYCGVGCQIDMHIRDDVIFRVTGREDNHVNFGNLCVKGRFGYDFVHAADRLATPFARESRDQALVPASWKEALDRVASRFTDLRDKHGADSLAFLTSAKCSNEENYLMQKLARGVVGTNNIDHCARL